MNILTRLRVGDEDFLVASMTGRCPTSMMIRRARAAGPPPGTTFPCAC